MRGERADERGWGEEGWCRVLHGGGGGGEGMVGLLMELAAWRKVVCPRLFRIGNEVRECIQIVH